MQLVIISDTHGKHEELGILSGDVLIHCGDFCDGFNINENDISNIDRWFGKQEFGQILCVGGNHDFVAQNRRTIGKTVFKNAIYLEDEIYEFKGVKFYGSPWLPDLVGWAHYLPGYKLSKKWEMIPKNTDVLITHTPPLGILDKPRTRQSVGCSHLRAALEYISPKIHCFGHIHASYGQTHESEIKFYNASIVNSNYSPVNPPFVVEL